MFYVVYFESANYAGYGQHCVVKADDTEEAKVLASEHVEEVFYEEDEDQWYSEHTHDPDQWAEIKKIEELDKGSEYAEFYKDKTQRDAFYPAINFQEEELLALL